MVDHSASLVRAAARRGRALSLAKASVPVVFDAWTQRTALAAVTPKPSAAARREGPPATAPTSLDRKSTKSGLPTHAGPLPSMQGESRTVRVGEAPMLQTGQVTLYLLRYGTSPSRNKLQE